MPKSLVAIGIPLLVNALIFTVMVTFPKIDSIIAFIFLGGITGAWIFKRLEKEVKW